MILKKNAMKWFTNLNVLKVNVCAKYIYKYYILFFLFDSGVKCDLDTFQ